jgi:hypothetical protein
MTAVLARSLRKPTSIASHALGKDVAMPQGNIKGLF